MSAVLNGSATVRGYHAYRIIWETSLAEEFVVLHQCCHDHQYLSCHLAELTAAVQDGKHAKFFIRDILLLEKGAE